MPKDYPREKDGKRLQFLGMNTVNPPDRMPPSKFPYAANVRAYLRDRIGPRARQDSSVLAAVGGTVYSIRRLNDSTPAGPPQGFILVRAASQSLIANNAQVASGLSGNPISLLPFRPNASVQPWMYVGDSNEMLKVRSDGTCYKMGVKEPQIAPSITFTAASDTVGLLGPVTVYYFNNDPHSAGSTYVWKNTDDPGAGFIQTIEQANGTTQGTSLLFDVGVSPPYASPSEPVQWQSYTTDTGTVTTAGTVVNWVSGNQFGNLVAGGTIVINAVSYILANPITTTQANITTSAGNQNDVNYFAIVNAGYVPLFIPALEPEGYSDFNCCILGTLYIPAAGTYTLSSIFKDDMLWGIGGTATGTASWAPAPLTGPTGTPTLGNGQTRTMANGYPLMPRTAETSGEGGFTGSASVAVTFSEAGNYPIEIDWEYWYHSGRILQILCNGVNIEPISSTTINEAQYRYVYRSSATGATSNPSPESAQSTISVLVNNVVATPSTDPQVDKIDFYRLDSGLDNFTYVGTGPNSSAAFSDSLLDSDVSSNPILEFDNYEPFPSIDLPAGGTVNVVGGVVEYVSGTKFNVRWLPGTIIIVGTIAFTLNTRPTSANSLTCSNVETVGGVETVVLPDDGTNLVYEIAEPDLAAQPLPYMWGPTDNINFAFAVGDPLRPGTLYWSKGNNLDSAPDTNQQDVTSPSEPLQNGCIVNGVGWVASSQRAWLIMPNFFNALATVTGTQGSTWTLQESSLKRGLYIPRCLCVDGGGVVYFRAKDGVYASPGGQGGKSITDDDLYNLFPHEGIVPQPVTIGGYTVYPPDDTQPELQQMNSANGYVYYDYVDVNSVRRTLVYDTLTGGWCVDTYPVPVAVHVLEEGTTVNTTLMGCTDGTVRPFTGTGVDSSAAVILMPSWDAGDTRASKHWADVYTEAEEG